MVKRQARNKQDNKLQLDNSCDELELLDDVPGHKTKKPKDKSVKPPQQKDEGFDNILEGFGDLEGISEQEKEDLKRAILASRLESDTNTRQELPQPGTSSHHDSQHSTSKKQGQATKSGTRSESSKKTSKATRSSSQEPYPTTEREETEGGGKLDTSHQVREKYSQEQVLVQLEEEEEEGGDTASKRTQSLDSPSREVDHLIGEGLSQGSDSSSIGHKGDSWSTGDGGKHSSRKKRHRSNNDKRSKKDDNAKSVIRSGGRTDEDVLGSFCSGPEDCDVDGRNSRSGRYTGNKGEKHTGNIVNRNEGHIVSTKGHVSITSRKSERRNMKEQEEDYVVRSTRKGRHNKFEEEEDDGAGDKRSDSQNDDVTRCVPETSDTSDVDDGIEPEVDLTHSEEDCLLKDSEPEQEGEEEEVEVQPDEESFYTAVKVSVEPDVDPDEETQPPESEEQEEEEEVGLLDLTKSTLVDEDEDSPYSQTTDRDVDPNDVKDAESVIGKVESVVEEAGSVAMEMESVAMEVKTAKAESVTEEKKDVAKENAFEEENLTKNSFSLIRRYKVKFKSSRYSPPFRPADMDAETYMKLIQQNLTQYTRDLRRVQKLLTSKIEWGPPVKTGQHYSQTIDAKMRGNKSQYMHFSEEEDEEEEKMPSTVGVSNSWRTDRASRTKTAGDIEEEEEKLEGSIVSGGWKTSVKQKVSSGSVSQIQSAETQEFDAFDPETEADHTVASRRPGLKSYSRMHIKRNRGQTVTNFSEGMKHVDDKENVNTNSLIVKPRNRNLAKRKRVPVLAPETQECDDEDFVGDVKLPRLDLVVAETQDPGISDWLSKKSHDLGIPQGSVDGSARTKVSITSGVKDNLPDLKNTDLSEEKLTVKRKRRKVKTLHKEPVAVLVEDTQDMDVNLNVQHKKVTRKCFRLDEDSDSEVVSVSETQEFTTSPSQEGVKESPKSSFIASAMNTVGNFVNVVKTVLSPPKETVIEDSQSPVIRKSRKTRVKENKAAKELVTYDVVKPVDEFRKFSDLQETESGQNKDMGDESKGLKTVARKVLYDADSEPKPAKILSPRSSRNSTLDRIDDDGKQDVRVKGSESKGAQRSSRNVTLDRVDDEGRQDVREKDSESKGAQRLLQRPISCDSTTSNVSEDMFVSSSQSSTVLDETDTKRSTQLGKVKTRTGARHHRKDFADNQHTSERQDEERGLEERIQEILEIDDSDDDSLGTGNGPVDSANALISQVRPRAIKSEQVGGAKQSKTGSSSGHKRAADTAFSLSKISGNKSEAGLLEEDPFRDFNDYFTTKQKVTTDKKMEKEQSGQQHMTRKVKSSSLSCPTSERILPKQNENISKQRKRLDYADDESPEILEIKDDDENSNPPISLKNFNEDDNIVARKPPTGKRPGQSSGSTQRKRVNYLLIRDDSSEEREIEERRTGTKRKRTMPPPRDEPQVKTVSCPLCNVNFPEDVVQDHAANCQGPDQGEEITKVVEEMKAGPDDISVTHQCYICDRQLADNEVFADHIKECMNRAREQQQEIDARGAGVFSPSREDTPSRLTRRRLREQGEPSDAPGSPPSRSGHESCLNETEVAESSSESWDETGSSYTDGSDDDVPLSSIIRSGSSALVAGPWNKQTHPRHAHNQTGSTEESHDDGIPIPDWLKRASHSPIKSFVKTSQQEDSEYFTNQFRYRQATVEARMAKRKKNHGKPRRKKRRKRKHTARKTSV